MDLSIIIVNYNVTHFLEQCLLSVQKAINKIDVEVIVVDNNSTEDTISFLQPKFPWARFIQNTTNTGFARANNQALQFTSGKYVLFLNPDTIIPENCFVKCIQFFQDNPEAGAIGVHMIDGGGHFLPESKRGFPSSWNAFTKMSGLIKVFPRSKKIAGYYMGHLSENENHEVDILSGAFMMVKKIVLEKSNGFDERFFMYAEDIDLSYQITTMGYKNYYFSGVSIIHFKGESTQRDLRYIKLFYKAMMQFVQKHYGHRQAYMYAGILNTAIRIRSAFSGFKNTVFITPKKHVDSHKKFSATGDKNSIGEAKEIMHNGGYHFSPDVNPAIGIVLCEGPEFSFAQMIDIMKNIPANNYFIHALGSSSVISSSEKEGQGELITRL